MTLTLIINSDSSLAVRLKPIYTDYSISYNSFPIFIRDMQRLGRLLPAVVAAVLQLQLCDGRKVGLCAAGGEACREEGKPWQRDGVCVAAARRGAGECVVPDSRSFKLTLVAEVLRLKTELPGAREVRNLWVRGSGPGLSWQRGARMKKTKEGEWQLHLEYLQVHE